MNPPAMSATGLPFSLWPLDAIALISFGLAWGGYNLVIDGLRC